METIGERVKTLRKRARMSQTELGDIIGLSTSGVASIEKGISKSPDKLQAIANHFKVSLEWIESGDGTAPEGIKVQSANAEAELYKDALYREMRAQIDFYKEIIRGLATGKQANFLNAPNVARVTGKVVSLILPEAQLGAQRA